MRHFVCLQSHLGAAVYGKSDLLWDVSVCDPFHKLQVGPHQSDSPLPTAGHKAPLMILVGVFALCLYSYCFYCFQFYCTIWCGSVLQIYADFTP